MDIHEVTPKDKDYPIQMLMVPNAEKYKLISIYGLIVVPLVQVIDIMSVVQPDVIVKNGECFCANCGSKMEKRWWMKNNEKDISSGSNAEQG